ncbi:hypothetical protein ABZ234_29695 [Nocardiopsis sp. NPDC006198]|uniref:hypothetical protein n=1 Tax=Nocardiopsis sp. NPDC006198 TaxID=3154472 RepID=UPI0033B26556
MELATEAAAGIVAAMTSDAWTQIREHCVTFFRRYLSGGEEVLAVAGLDANHRALAAVPSQARQATAEAYARTTADDLAALLERSPEAAEQLRDLVAEVNERTATAEPKTKVAVENVRAGGDVIVAGNNVNMGDRR